MPVGVPPVKVNPRVYTFPLIDILDGVAATVADPPLIDNEKSLTSNAPLPPKALNTGSENVTVTVELSVAMVVPLMVGGVVSGVATVIPVFPPIVLLLVVDQLLRAIKFVSATTIFKPVEANALAPMLVIVQPGANVIISNSVINWNALTPMLVSLLGKIMEGIVVSLNESGPIMSDLEPGSNVSDTKDWTL